jgi:hypothetical protein
MINHKHLPFSLFGWLMADGCCWFVLRKEYCWLVADGWFVVREEYCWLVVDNPSEQGFLTISSDTINYQITLSLGGKLAASDHDSQRGESA